MTGPSKLFLFTSGIFFGGAVDHVILALKRSEHTPYGVRSGVAGNWWLAALDTAIAATGYVLHRRLSGPTP
jgi:hypothetical protein